MIVRSDIFSTPVWHIKDIPSPLVDELYEAAYRIKETSTEMVNRSNQGGFQTKQFQWEIFHPQGKEYIKNVIEEIFENYYWRISGWWYNINPEGASNIPHVHPAVQYVLIIYLTDCDGLLQLFNPNVSRIHMEDIHLTLASPEVKKGEMIIFPADIIHFVDVNKKKEDRISISMNIQIGCEGDIFYSSKDGYGKLQ